MRTTVILDADVAEAVAQLRRERGISASDALNELVRRGQNPQVRARQPFRQATADLGLRLDVTRTPHALDVLDGADA